MAQFKEVISKKTDEELMDIYIKSEDYQADFINAVEKEISNRNLDIGSINQKKNEIETNNDKNILEGIKGNTLYLLSFIILAGIGGLFAFKDIESFSRTIRSVAIGVLAITLGFRYGYLKRKDSKGNEYYSYDQSTRVYGQILLIMGAIIFAIILYKLTQD